jgi:NAD(P)-dependent dehydrogenase (short-subunit alcohol dehydrogenase family)
MPRATRVEIKVMQELLRHASSRVTMDTYTQAVTAQKRKAQSGVIRLEVPNPIPVMSGSAGVYSADKAGMHGFTKALALELAKKGVTINTISPGYIGTKMVMAIPKDILDGEILSQIPLDRLGKPDEVAGLIVYLCSDEAAFVTGANVSINGGQHKCNERVAAHTLLILESVQL